MGMTGLDSVASPQTACRARISRKTVRTNNNCQQNSSSSVRLRGITLIGPKVS